MHFFILTQCPCSTAEQATWHSPHLIGACLVDFDQIRCGLLFSSIFYATLKVTCDPGMFSNVCGLCVLYNQQSMISETNT